MNIIAILVFILCVGCTFSVNLIHTSGTATDVIDEDQKADADVSPTVTVPVKAI